MLLPLSYRGNLVAHRADNRIPHHRDQRSNVVPAGELGADGLDRTGGLALTRGALCQLSYISESRTFTPETTGINLDAPAPLKGTRTVPGLHRTANPIKDWRCVRAHGACEAMREQNCVLRLGRHRRRSS